jgi:hypothetical protein
MILANQINSSPWKNLRSIVHKAPRNKTWDSFIWSESFHMLVVFFNDATEHKGITSVIV